MAAARGFILQASYRVIAAANGRRLPVVQLYGRLEDGGAFLVRDDRQRPHFYVRASDAERAAALNAREQHATDQRTFEGDGVRRVEVNVPSDVPPLRDALHQAGIDTFEADVRFASRYLIERGIKGGCEIEGPSLAQNGASSRVFENPILRPAAVTLEPRVLSFDIETDAKGERLLAISLFAPGIDEVLIVDGSSRPMPELAVRCANEAAALEGFAARVASFDPDVLTGWNIIDFDLSVLEKIAQRVGHSLSLGREPGAMRIRKADGYFGSGQASMPGPSRAGRHRPVARRVHPQGRLFARCRGARRCSGEGKAVTSGDARDRLTEIHAQLRAQSSGLCALRAHRCAPRFEHRGEVAPRSNSPSPAANSRA